MLYFTRDVLIPVSFALLISFVLYPFCAWLERRGVSRLLSILIAISVVILVMLLLVALLITQVLKFADEWPNIYTRLMQSAQAISAGITSLLHLSPEQQKEMISQWSSQSGGRLLSLLRQAISVSTVSLVFLLLTPVYAVLILLYRHHWMHILQKLFGQERPEKLRAIMQLTIQTYYNFIKGMAVVYLLVGTLNSVGLLLLGIPHAILFGFIASILTFIPYVGIMAGSLLPITMAWITHDSIWYPLGVIGVFTFVQYLEANIIFPLAVSSRLNVNTLVMLIAIFAGGLLWGMAGLILFVPFVGILKLIADHNPRWKTLSMILGTPQTSSS